MVLRQRRRSKRARSVRTVRVRVRGRYEPSVLHARVGEPLRIVFSREETASCSEHVVFPAFGKSAMLPPFENVALEVVPEHAGDYEFMGQLGMLRGLLVVDGDTVERSASVDSASAGHAGGPVSGGIAGECGDPVLLAFVAWICGLPLLLLITVPFLGWRGGGVLALLLLGIIAAACFALCARRLATASAYRASGRTQVQGPG
jgi:hypothetical protein